MTATEPDFSIRPIDGNWHLVVTTNGQEAIFPAGSELHAKVLMGLEKEREEYRRKGLRPPRG